MEHGLKVTAITTNQVPRLTQQYGWLCHKCRMGLLRPLLLPRFLNATQPQTSSFPTLWDCWLQELQEVIQINPIGHVLFLEPPPTLPPAFTLSCPYPAWNAPPPDSCLANFLTPFTSLLTRRHPSEACRDHLIRLCLCSQPALPDLHCWFFSIALNAFQQTHNLLTFVGVWLLRQPIIIVRSGIFVSFIDVSKVPKIVFSTQQALIRCICVKWM